MFSIYLISLVLINILIANTGYQGRIDNVPVLLHVFLLAKVEFFGKGVAHVGDFGDGCV